MLLLPAVAFTWDCYIYSITTTFFCSLSTTTMSGWLAIIGLSVWIWKSHRVLALTLSVTLNRVSHMDCRTSSPFTAQNIQTEYSWTLFQTPCLLCTCRLCLPASYFRQSLLSIICRDVSGSLCSCILSLFWCGRPSPFLLLCCLEKCLCLVLQFSP